VSKCLTSLRVWSQCIAACDFDTMGDRRIDYDD
jgi:hypothetical protein